MSEFNSKTVYNNAEVEKLIKPEILKILDEQLFSAWLDPVAESLWFVTELLEIPNGEFTTMLWTHWLQVVGEFDELPLVNKEQGYVKWYKTERRWGTIGISKEARKWIETAVGSPKLSPMAKQELNKLRNDVTTLVNAAKITRNEVATEVLALWFVDTNAYWPGSASPDWEPLFSASHIIKSTWETQSNLVSGALTAAKLKEAIELLRNMRDWKGRKMKRAKTYTLIVSSENEANARKILNDGSNFAAYEISTGTALPNGVTSNLFMWDWFRIELMVLDTLNQPKEDWTTVGSATMWFVLNREAAREMMAFKYLSLYNEEMDMWEDKKTKAIYIDVDLQFTFDHYQPEVIVWSQGI